MDQPADLILDIQARLDRMIRQYQTLIDHNKKLETENTSLAQSLKEALQQQETLRKKLDAIQETTLRETQSLDQWKSETRREVKNIMKEVEKCLPQVEALMEK
jgi:cell division septum initiation protein DivIVA